MAALEERAAELAGLTRFDDEAETISPDDADVAIRTRRGKIAVRAPRGRRRWTAIAVPRGRRHRGQAPRPQSGGADLQHRPFAAASKYLDGVSHPAGPVRVRAAARRPLQRGVGLGAEGSRAADGAERRRIVGGRGTAIAFDSRPRHGRAGTASVSAGDRAARGNSPGIASRWSAKPRMCCRRSARRASTWDCAMPPISPTSCARRCSSGEDPGSPQVLKRYDSARRADVAEPDLRDRYRQPLAAQRFPADASRCARPACI